MWRILVPLRLWLLLFLVLLILFCFIRLEKIGILILRRFIRSMLILFLLSMNKEKSDIVCCYIGFVYFFKLVLRKAIEGLGMPSKWLIFLLFRRNFWWRLFYGLGKVRIFLLLGCVLLYRNLYVLQSRILDRACRNFALFDLLLFLLLLRQLKLSSLVRLLL